MENNTRTRTAKLHNALRTTLLRQSKGSYTSGRIKCCHHTASGSPSSSPRNCAAPPPTQSPTSVHPAKQNKSP
eukprot:2283786-Alexandrium_andersonii.AAC.1